jgi:hypothetical protein
MNVDRSLYFDRLYPLQDKVLRAIGDCNTDFYLTGGTALSRAYLQHRFSDDLGLFVNTATARGDDPRFRQWCKRVVEQLQSSPQWRIEVPLQGQYFMRLFVTESGTTLKVEFVDDVVSHIGAVVTHPVLGRLDSPENILANKVTALRDRDEDKDLADIWGLCTRLGLSLEEAIGGALTKTSGVYHADIARRLCTATRSSWEAVRWIDPPDPDQYLADLTRLGEELILPPEALGRG